MSWVGDCVQVLLVVKLCRASRGKGPDPILLFLSDSSRRNLLWSLVILDSGMFAVRCVQIKVAVCM